MLDRRGPTFFLMEKFGALPTSANYQLRFATKELEQKVNQHLLKSPQKEIRLTGRATVEGNAENFFRVEKVED